MERGLDGIASDVAVGRGPSPADLEDLFLASHSLKGTGLGFGAEELGRHAGELSHLAREWSSDQPPTPDQITEARQLLERIRAECDEVIARADAESAAPTTPPPD